MYLILYCHRYHEYHYSGSITYQLVIAIFDIVVSFQGRSLVKNLFNSIIAPKMNFEESLKGIFLMIVCTFPLIFVITLFYLSKFPPEVLSDESMMNLLSSCATRIEHMQVKISEALTGIGNCTGSLQCVQVPRYQSLKKILSDILNHFLSITNTSNDEAMSLTRRKQLLLDHIASTFTRNIADRNKFVGSCGFSEKFMDGVSDTCTYTHTSIVSLTTQEFSITVETDGSHSLEENMRQTLLTCYSEFLDILKQLGITHVRTCAHTCIDSIPLFE